MSYISFPIISSVDDLLQEAYAYIKARKPQWVENDANLDTWILQVYAQQGSDLRELATDVPDTIFRYFGRTMVALPPIEATAATVGSTWTMIDNAGYTVPAGTVVSIRNDSGEEIPFQTLVDVVVSAGSTVANGVALQAIQAGSAGSGIGGNTVPATLQDTLDYVVSVVLTGLTTGGLDAESDQDYLDRLALYIRRLSLRPILPGDFAALALDADPSVYRAVAIDGYNPANQTYNNERYVAVAAIDENGANLSSGIKSAIDALLQANREINFVVNVMDPTRTSIDVTFTAKARPGFILATVETEAEAAVADYLDPAKWGLDPRYTDTGAARTWIETTTLRYFNIAQVIENVEGVDYISALTINKTGQAAGTVDVALTAPAALTTVGTIAGTVT
jgi:hypothetical protein